MAHEELKDQRLEDFVMEYNLQNIAQPLYDQRVKIDELCSKSDNEISAFASKLSANIKDRNKFKDAIYDLKVKLDEENEKKEENENKIIIQGLNGKTLSLSITPNTTIKDIKQQIEEKEGWPQKQQKLVFAGRFLDDDNAKIRKYNITKDSVIHINLQSKKECCIL